MNNNLYNLIDCELEKEAKRIFDYLYDLYINKTKVNKFITDLIKDNIDTKFSIYLVDIQRKVINLIPNNLTICITGEWVFIENNDMNLDNNLNIYNEIDKLSLDIANKISNLDMNEKYDFFEIISDYIHNINFDDYILKNYLITKINYYLNFEGIKIINLCPLDIKKY